MEAASHDVVARAGRQVKFHVRFSDRREVGVSLVLKVSLRVGSLLGHAHACESTFFPSCVRTRNLPHKFLFSVGVIQNSLGILLQLSSEESVSLGLERGSHVLRLRGHWLYSWAFKEGVQVFVK